MNGKRSREGTPKPQGVIRRPRKSILSLLHAITNLPLQAAPLNLANASSLHLLTPAEQTLCSQLRILPKPFLVIKETLVSEFAKRGGKLRRREARDLIKIDVNKTSRIWDFLVLAGVLKVPSPVEVKPVGGSVEEEGAGAVAAPASNPP
jgi:transcriptional adapter 2-alpha